MKSSILIVVAFLTTEVCVAQENFSWLVGTWKSKDKPVYEVWHLDSIGVLKGHSFKITDGDTVVLEQITLQRLDDGYYYIPDVPENDSPVHFKISSSTVSSFIAENYAHDFPKVIKYTIVRKDENEFLEASIEGNGKVIPFSFQKVK